MNLIPRICICILFLSQSEITYAVPAWTSSEMVNIQVIKDIQISPDNQFVVYAATSPVFEENKDYFSTKLYLADIAGKSPPKLLTTDNSCNVQPRWSPNGEWIAFLSDRTGILQLYLIKSLGETATPLTHTQKSIETFKWAPDSLHIAFVMPEIASSDQNAISDAYIYENNPSINQLWTINIDGRNPPKVLTPKNIHVRGRGDFGTSNEEFDWSPDGKKITFAYSTSPGLQNFYTQSSIATIHLDNDEIVYWKNNLPHESLPRYSPDGQLIAYLESDNTSAFLFNRRIAIRASNSTQYRQLALTTNGGPFLMGSSLLGWHKNGDGLLFFEPIKTKFHIQFIPINDRPSSEIASDKWLMQIPALSPDGSMIGLSLQTPDIPQEVFVTPVDQFQPKQISSLNERFNDYPKAQTTVISWEGSDGKIIEGLLTLPIHYEQGKRYPLLLVIHGGPIGVFSEIFLGNAGAYPLAPFAEAGFAILRPNPRGSTGYGIPFREANYQDLGGKDFEDIMAGIDHLIKQGIADEDKLGVMGWSYGGYMSAWAITQTTRFKAASVGAAPTDWTNLALTMDLTSFVQEFMGDFVDNAELYRARSPIFYAANVQTPCLLQHGIDDKRVPISGAYEFYRALKLKSKAATLVIYPRSGHAINEPKLQIDLLEKNLMWFKEHLNIQ